MRPLDVEQQAERQPLASPTHVDYNKVRDAYQRNDVQSLRDAHDNPEEGEHDGAFSSFSSTIKSITFGGVDGILTSFAIVAGAAGGGMGPSVVLVLGFSNILADALAMGVGEYLSSKAQYEYVLAERRREEWELQNHREGEVREMIDIYVQRGMDREDAEVVLRRIAKYDSFFVDVMMAEELAMPMQDFSDAEGLMEGVVMFCSFAFFGSLPLLGYCVCPLVFGDLSDTALFNIACFVTAVFLFVLGIVKASSAPGPGGAQGSSA
eukprot:CAMPEP_0113939514 /NCGR_PEP_ID=MMETSP1339-20121228/5814_1 /TAXON_ID=94617 /ORGANISM="Fibrocapsa japonica" /LENGTH=264 /DNA_ID=CAMNT_0000943031 /DNA_START=173 /DNA_END=968 /DNA_ORIENTATION=- /assembly_acc=CAM_ASM_000762